MNNTIRDQSLLRFIIGISGRHQLGLAVLSVLLFTIGTIPIEIQRRIVNLASERGPYSAIALLASVYCGLVIAEGLLKLLLNVYRSWVGESAIRWFRMAIFDLPRGDLVDWYRTYRVTEVRYDLVLKAMRGEAIDPTIVGLHPHAFKILGND